MWATPDLEILATLSISEPVGEVPKGFPALHPGLFMLRVCSPPALTSSCPQLSQVNQAPRFGGACGVVVAGS